MHLKHSDNLGPEAGTYSLGNTKWQKSQKLLHWSDILHLVGVEPTTKERISIASSLEAKNIACLSHLF